MAKNERPIERRMGQSCNDLQNKRGKKKREKRRVRQGKIKIIPNNNHENSKSKKILRNQNSSVLNPTSFTSQRKLKSWQVEGLSTLTKLHDNKFNRFCPRNAQFP